MEHIENITYERASEIIRGEHKTIRWVEEIDLLNDPTDFLEIWVFMAGTSGVLTGLLVFIAAIERGIMSAIVLLPPYLLLLCIATVILLIGYYLLYLPIHGRYYTVLFEMDLKGVRHILMSRDCRREKVAAELNIEGGYLNFSPTLTGAELITYRKSEIFVPYFSIKKVVSNKHKARILLVSSKLRRSLIYTSQQDYMFIRSYILKHCGPNVKEVKR